MTFSGKRLQDIYDAGAERLAAAEVAAVTKLKSLNEEHSQALKKDISGCADRMQGTASHLKLDLNKYIDGAAARLRSAIDLETDQTKEHALSLLSEVNNLAEKLKAAVVTIRKAHAENADYLNTSVSDRFMGALERGKAEFGKHDYASSRHLKAHGTFIANSLQQKLDHVLWESRGGEKQVTGSLFKAYMQKANAIDGHFSQLMQQLSSEFQMQYKALESLVKRAESEVDGQAKANLLKIDEQAQQIESQISEHFKKLTEQHRLKLDGDLSSVAEDLSQIHDAITERMVETGQKLGEGLVEQSTHAHENLQKRCQDMKQAVGVAMIEFNKKLSERIFVSEELKLLLESDRDNIVTAIRSELASIRDSFKKRVSSLISLFNEKVGKAAGEAESEIRAAQKKFDEQLTNESMANKKDMDGEVEKFLQLLGERRRAALDEVVRLSGNNISPFPAKDDLTLSQPTSSNKKDPDNSAH